MLDRIILVVVAVIPKDKVSAGIIMLLKPDIPLTGKIFKLIERTIIINSPIQNDGNDDSISVENLLKWSINRL